MENKTQGTVLSDQEKMEAIMKFYHSEDSTQEFRHEVERMIAEWAKLQLEISETCLRITKTQR